MPFKSPVYKGHSPFSVLGCAPAGPDTLDVAHDPSPTTSITNTGTHRNTFRDIVHSLLVRDNLIGELLDEGTKVGPAARPRQLYALLPLAQPAF
ncbi:MAG: hypothetical protein ACE5HV_04315 [Acidobacteriota bacterium]